MGIRGLGLDTKTLIDIHCNFKLDKPHQIPQISPKLFITNKHKLMEEWRPDKDVNEV